MNNAFKGNIAPLNFEAWQEKEFEKLVKKGRTVTCPVVTVTAWNGALLAA